MSTLGNFQRVRGMLRLLARSVGLSDDRPNVPLRFLAEANLTQILRRQEQHADPGEARAQLNDRIKSIFGGTVFNLYPFPGGPYEVPDDAGDGKPSLVLMGFDAVEVASDNVAVPELVGRIYAQKDASGGLRLNRNNLVFLLADQARKEEMRHKIVRRDRRLPPAGPGRGRSGRHQAGRDHGQL
jgi:hypothetical protein